MRLALVFLSGLLLLGCSSERTSIVASQWNVINYWAIWCKPCREEIPELNQLNQIENVVVLGVNFDGKVGEALVSDADELGITFDIIDDPAPSLNIARPSVLPTTVVLSPEGKLVATLVGPQTAESIMAHIGRDKRTKIETKKRRLKSRRIKGATQIGR